MLSVFKWEHLEEYSFVGKAFIPLRTICLWQFDWHACITNNGFVVLR